MSMLGLAAFPAPRTDLTFSREQILPTKREIASRIGPNVVVVYTPNSLDDLCLLWDLRSANGLPRGFPLGVPDTENVEAIVRSWEKERAFAWWGWGGGRERCLVSLSVDRARLEAIAAGLGDQWIVVDAYDLLRSSSPPGRPSSDIVTLSGGLGRVASWSPSEVQQLDPSYSRYEGLSLRLRARPLNQILPPSPSLAMDAGGNHVFRGGAFEASARGPQELAYFVWPAGWTVLEAMARDRGLVAKPSPPGLACEAMLKRMGSMAHVQMLLSADVITMLHRLGERTGMSWFRQQVRDLRKACAIADEQATAIEAHLAAIAASTEEDRYHDVDFGRVRSAVGNKTASKVWLAWAEESGCLIRGAEVSCGNCQARSWRAVAEIAPPVVCRGCGNPIARPFDGQSLQFRYRASETLLRVLEHDAISHLIALRWIVSLFSPGFEEPSRVLGGYPGVSFFEADGTEVGEADVTLVLTSGEFALGECKRSPAGLNEGELRKLDRLADRLGASWTFLATPSPAAECPDLWRESAARPPNRPRFCLTAEHLFGLPHWLAGKDPFAWPSDEDGTPELPGFPDQVVGTGEWLAGHRNSDGELHQRWRWEDSRGAASSESASTHAPQAKD